jgi:ABC-type lipoprotein export system ATPase subunit
MVLDQPLSNLDSTYLPKAGQLITELSEKLDIQFLMINHNPALADIATKTFEVVKDGNISKII